LQPVFVNDRTNDRHLSRLDLLLPVVDVSVRAATRTSSLLAARRGCSPGRRVV